MKSKLSITEEELHRAKAELSNLRKNNAVLDGGYHEQDKVIVQLKTKLAVLEQEVKDKDSLLNKTTDMLQSEQGQKVSFFINEVPNSVIRVNQGYRYETAQ